MARGEGRLNYLSMLQTIISILLPNSLSFPGRTGPSPSHPLSTVPTSLPRSQPSLVLLPMQDNTEGEFFLQRLWTPFAGSNSPPSRLSRIWASPARILWHYFHFDLWPRPWAWPDCWVFLEFLYAPIPWKGSGRTTTTTIISINKKCNKNRTPWNVFNNFYQTMFKVKNLNQNMPKNA